MRTFTYSQIGKIAYPILVSAIMEQLLATTDTAFLGRVGEVELGASALGGVFYTCVFMLGLGFSVGTQILMARRNGEGNKLQIGPLFYHGVAFLLVLSLLLFAGVRLFAPSLLERIISSQSVAEAANSYLYWRVFGFFFAFVNIMFRAFYVATTHTRTLTLNSVVMVLSNVAFNYVLIFGACGFPAMGIAGAALGSSLAEAVSTVFFVVYTRRCVPCADYALNRMPRFRFSVLRKVLGISVWTMVQNFLSLATWFIFFVCVEHLGESSLAATNIIRSISSFTFMTIIAFASTASTLVSNLLGEGEASSVWPMLRRTVKMTFFVLLPILALIACFPNAVIRIFTDDESLIGLSRNALYVLLASNIVTVPTQILLHAVSGTGNTRITLRAELAALFFYVVYVLVAIFHFRVSLPWCWASEFVYGIVALAVSFAYMRWGRWQNKAI